MFHRVQSGSINYFHNRSALSTIFHLKNKFLREIALFFIFRQMNTEITSIDAYIATFPTAVQVLLDEMRQVIRSEAPEVTECLSYGIPTFQLFGKNFVHFGAYKKHIGFYPAPSAIRHFEERLTAFKRAKGSVQFPLDQPLPLDLVREMVLWRLQQEQEKQKGKG